MVGVYDWRAFDSVGVYDWWREGGTPSAVGIFEAQRTQRRSQRGDSSVLLVGVDVAALRCAR